MVPQSVHLIQISRGQTECEAATAVSGVEHSSALCTLMGSLQPFVTLIHDDSFNLHSEPLESLAVCCGRTSLITAIEIGLEELTVGWREFRDLLPDERHDLGFAPRQLVLDFQRCRIIRQGRHRIRAATGFPSELVEIESQLLI